MVTQKSTECGLPVSGPHFKQNTDKVKLWATFYVFCHKHYLACLNLLKTNDYIVCPAGAKIGLVPVAMFAMVRENE